MNGGGTKSAPSRGASKRAQRRDERIRREALAWWAQPGVLVFLAALVVAVMGWLLVLRGASRIPVEQARLGGLDLHVLEARWLLDQMAHGENFQKPSTMMPDMPAWGQQRVTLELTVDNHSSSPQVFDGAEFWLVPEIGDERPPIGANVGLAQLAPGQTLNTALHFDLDTTLPHGKILIEWRRAGDTAYLPVPAPAEHYHLRPRGGELALPPDARLVLPLGEAERGGRLFRGIFGCAACHGAPDLPGSNNVGPHLAGIGTAAATRVEGMPAAQYIYESIIDPGGVIAPDCGGGKPCQEPSAMPEYASLMGLQDIADVMVYLLEQREGGTEGRALEAPRAGAETREGEEE